MELNDWVLILEGADWLDCAVHDCRVLIAARGYANCLMSISISEGNCMWLVMFHVSRKNISIFLEKKKDTNTIF